MLEMVMEIYFVKSVRTLMYGVNDAVSPTGTHFSAIWA